MKRAETVEIDGEWRVQGLEFATFPPPIAPETSAETMRSSPSSYLGLVVLLCGIFLGVEPARAQGDGDVEAKFTAMLKNATLKGSWAPVQQGTLGGERGNDSYRIARAEKSGDGKWSIVSVINYQGRQIEFPIPATVKFAGDTAVLILDDVKAGPGKANWSARVMFFDDVYAGRWYETSNKEHGGTINGTITRKP